MADLKYQSDGNAVVFDPDESILLPGLGTACAFAAFRGGLLFAPGTFSRRSSGGKQGSKGIGSLARTGAPEGGTGGETLSGTGVF